MISSVVMLSTKGLPSSETRGKGLWAYVHFSESGLVSTVPGEQLKFLGGK